VLEQARGVGTVVFDKTGTLTRGQCSLLRVVWFSADGGSDDGEGEACGEVCGDDGRSGGARGGARRKVIQLIAAAEAGSEHPLARAVAAYAESQLKKEPGGDAAAAAGGGGGGGDDVAIVDDDEAPPLHVEAVEAAPGRGIKALAPAAWRAVAAAAVAAAAAEPDAPPTSAVCDQAAAGLAAPPRPAGGSSCCKRVSAPPPSQPSGLAASAGQVGVYVGNAAWMRECGVALPQAALDRVAALEASLGATVVVAAVGGAAVALLAIADETRPEAAGVLRALERRGVEAWMVTGDSRCGARDGAVVLHAAGGAAALGGCSRQWWRRVWPQGSV
jgi:Cu+-exporting ATPase